MPQQSDNPARAAVLHDLQRAALDMYGEERSAEATLQTALRIAATAIWRLSEESFEPLDFEPLPTHD